MKERAGERESNLHCRNSYACDECGCLFVSSTKTGISIINDRSMEQ